MGAHRILLNRNHDEVVDLVRFAIDRGIDISFIEEMPLGAIGDHDRAEAYFRATRFAATCPRTFEPTAKPVIFRHMNATGG